MKKEPISDLMSFKFGKLIIIKEVDNKSKRSALCLCDCGKETVVNITNLKTGHTTSCGCKKLDIKHGKSRTRLYRTWCSMIHRCYNPKAKVFDRYGKRGITICDEWLENFLVFYNWALKNGYKDNLTIDRTNNDGGYSPQNCRWVTRAENSRNKSDTKLTINDIKKIRFLLAHNKTQNEIAEIYKIDQSHVSRIKHNLTWENIFC